MAESNLEKTYAKMLAKREATATANAAKGNMSGVPLNDQGSTRAGSLSDVIQNIKNKGGLAQNVENTVKSTPTDTIGISPEVAYKSRFANIKKAMGGALTDAEGIGKNVNEEAGSLLHNQGGFSKVLPALGLGAAALGALGIANKVQAGEYGQAGLDTADLATDYVPGLGQAKMAVRPSELGNSELPADVMEQRNVFNAARKSKEGEPVNNPSNTQPLLAPEDRATNEDLKKQFQFNVFNKMK